MKKVRRFSAIGVVLGVILLAAANGFAALAGDVDGSGTVDLKDTMMSLQISIGITPLLTVNRQADVDGDGLIGLKEALYSLQFAAGFITCTDNDGDGYSTKGGYCGFVDCDDANAAVFPGATEACNGLDDNCNGTLDEGTWLTALFFKDADGDGFGNGDWELCAWACAAPPGYAPDGNDCNDDDATVYPGALEIHNGIDDNCNGKIDEDLPYYKDNDGDGYGNPNAVVQADSKPPGYVIDNTDCNDSKAAINPGAVEICNEIDDNCNGSVDEGVQNTYYLDWDGDGYGDPKVIEKQCEPPTKYVTNNTDCNDGNAAVNPGASEICNEIDDNCNGLIDDGVVMNTYYRDVDGDGYGSSLNFVISCSQPAGYVMNNADCNDYVYSIKPGAAEICGNWVDDNCNGTSDEGCPVCTDNDGDGYNSNGGYCGAVDCNDSNAAVNPSAAEVVNGIDDNCNGTIDEGLTSLFPDPNLDAAVRAAINKPSGNILISDVQSLTYLDAYSRGIFSLEGLQYCTNLTSLELGYNKVIDLSPLAGLTNLTSLNLFGNQINISQLAGFTNLTVLHLDDNQISNLSPLAGLTNLTWITLNLNQISDLSPLAGLTNLTRLDLIGNPIIDLSPLAGLTNLTKLYLAGNQIADIKALVDNAGINSGDIINLASNPLSATSCTVYIPQLESRGVTVWHSCP